MDVLDKLQIFVPVEAEVTTVPLNSLPRSVRRRIDLQRPRHDGSSGPSPPPEVTSICPVVLRMRGQRVAGAAPEKLSFALSSRVGALQAPLQMSIVSPNRTAYNLLRGVNPGRLTPPDPHEALPAAVLPGCRAAVILYRGNIYLSIKRQIRHHRSRLASPAVPTSSSDVSSTSQREEALGDSRPELQRSSRTAGGHQDAPTQQDATISDGQEARSHSSKAEGSSPGQSVGPGATASSSSSSSSPQFDFKALAQQEKIAQMKARLQQNQAAVNKL